MLRPNAQQSSICLATEVRIAHYGALQFLALTRPRKACTCTSYTLVIRKQNRYPPREGGLLRRLGARSRCFCCLDPIPPLRGGQKNDIDIVNGSVIWVMKHIPFIGAEETEGESLTNKASASHLY